MNGMHESAERAESAETLETPGAEGAEGAVRARFHRGLTQLPTGFAPVDTAMRRGRRIRTRRRVTVGGSLALAVALGALAVAGAGRWDHASPPAKRPAVHTVTEATGSPQVVGQVATGTVDRVAWSVTVDTHSDMYPDSHCAIVASAASAEGSAGAAGPTMLACSMLGQTKDPAVFEAVGGPDVPDIEIGQVRPDVTSLDVVFGDGETLRLVPVAANGASYVAFAKPEDLAVARVEAHFPAGGGYAIPYNPPFGSAQIITWYDDARTASPAVSTPTVTPAVVLVEGSWSATVAIGPWGRCLSVTGSRVSYGSVRACEPVGSSRSRVRLTPAALGSDDSRQLYFGDIDPAVARIVFADTAGRTLEVPVKPAADGHVYCVVILPRAAHIKNTTYYDAAGEVLFTGP